MLVAMFFGPIVGIALGVAEADIQLLGRSFVAEVVGVVWVLAIGLGLGVIFRNFPIGSEVLSRTSPGTLDLLIALTGGFVGTLTYLATGVSGVILGQWSSSYLQAIDDRPLIGRPDRRWSYRVWLLSRSLPCFPLASPTLF